MVAAKSGLAIGGADARRAAVWLARWPGDRESVGARRGLQVTLGVVWLADAVLQYQPFMFGKGFVDQVLAPAQAGNPAVVAAVPLAAGHLINATQPVSNAAFATIQLLLGVALLWRPAVRAGLAGTVAWSLAVWWLGEGLGGVLSGGQLLTGAPGAAVIYAFLAVLIWPSRSSAAWRPGSGGPGDSVAAGGLLGGMAARLGWLAVWASAAYLALVPANRAPGALAQAIGGQAAGEPGFLAGLDHQAAAVLAGRGFLAAAVIAVIAAVVGCAVFVPAVTRPVLALAMLLSLTVWVVGENFGGILAGNGTDPSSGVPLLLLAIAFWPRRRSQTTRVPALAAPGAGCAGGSALDAHPRPAGRISGSG